MLKSTLEKEFPGTKVTLVDKGTTNFSVLIGKEVVFSTSGSGRLPNETEIIELVKK